MRKCCASPISLALVIAAMLAMPRAAAAQALPWPPMTAAEQFAFGRHLYREGEYYRAVSELGRFVFFFPDHEKAVEARLKIAQARFHLGEYPEAITAFQQVIETASEPALRTSAYLGTAHAWRRLGQPAPAAGALRQLLAATDDPEARDQAHFLLGWIRLEEREWEKAAAAWEEISTSPPDRLRLGELARRHGGAWRERRKDPDLAGCLSIIPGGGFWYARQYARAVGAFLLNGIMIYAAASAFDQERYALGGLAVLMETGFYAGNIRGGRAAAEAYNQALHARMLEIIQADLSPGSEVDGHPGGVVFSLSIPF